MATRSSAGPIIVEVRCPKCETLWGKAELYEPVNPPSRAKPLQGFKAKFHEAEGVTRWICPVRDCPGARPFFWIAEDVLLVGVGEHW